jgi:hypothetical protein
MVTAFKGLVLNRTTSTEEVGGDKRLFDDAPPCQALTFRACCSYPSLLFSFPWSPLPFLAWCLTLTLGELLEDSALGGPHCEDPTARTPLRLKLSCIYSPYPPPSFSLLSHPELTLTTRGHSITYFLSPFLRTLLGVLTFCWCSVLHLTPLTVPA